LRLVRGCCGMEIDLRGDSHEFAVPLPLSGIPCLGCCTYFGDLVTAGGRSRSSGSTMIGNCNRGSAAPMSVPDSKVVVLKVNVFRSTKVVWRSPNAENCRLFRGGMDSLKRVGQMRETSGLRQRSEAQIMPVFASMEAHRTAAIPETDDMVKGVSE
jgi:hypothetical protein